MIINCRDVIQPPGDPLTPGTLMDSHQPQKADRGERGDAADGDEDCWMFSLFIEVSILKCPKRQACHGTKGRIEVGI